MAFYYTAHALSTVERIKDLLNIPQDDTTYDRFYNSQINVISRRIETFCKRHLEVQTMVQEPYSGNGRQWLTLLKRPIITISNIQIVDIAVTDYRTPTPEEAEAGLVFRQYGWFPGMLATRSGLDIGDPHPTYIYYNTLVDYTAGYVSAAAAGPGMEDMITLPDDIEGVLAAEIDRQQSILLARGLTKQITPVGHEEQYGADDLSDYSKDVLYSYQDHNF